MLRGFLFGLAIVLVGLAPARADGLTSIPASAPDDPKAFWKAAMEEFYGPYDRGLKCWTAAHDNETLCMRPHLLVRVGTDAAPEHYVAMAGYAVDRDGIRYDCHACGGKLGLAILRPRGDRLELVARNSLAADAGSWGVVPSEEAFRVVDLGQGRHGWLMEFSYTAQGYTEGGTQVFGPIADRIVDLGFISAYSDNRGTCGEDLGVCYTHHYEIVADPQAAGTGFASLLARKVESTRSDAPETIRIEFSEEEQKYLTPERLEAAIGN